MSTPDRPLIVHASTVDGVLAVIHSAACLDLLRLIRVKMDHHARRAVELGYPKVNITVMVLDIRDPEGLRLAKKMGPGVDFDALKSKYDIPLYSGPASHTIPQEHREGYVPFLVVTGGQCLKAFWAIP